VGNPKADTWEIYAALNWKWLSAKYSYSLKNETFAVKESDGTWYLDLTANMPLGEWIGVNGLNFVAHWGWQKYSGTDPRNWTVGGLPLSNDEIYSYKDWKVGFTYTLPKDFTIGVMYTDTSGSNVLGYGSVTDCNANRLRRLPPQSGQRHRDRLHPEDVLTGSIRGAGSRSPAFSNHGDNNETRHSNHQAVQA